jgi:phospholipid/cholesterol/gamma-HCH transport system substrate-binding protein
LDGLIETAERNQNKLGKVLEKLNSADSSAGKMLQDKEFWEMTKETLDRLNEFLRELKSNPKKYFKFSIF